MLIFQEQKLQHLSSMDTSLTSLCKSVDWDYVIDGLLKDAFTDLRLKNIKHRYRDVAFGPPFTN